MPCSVVEEYQHFRELCCLHLQGEVNDIYISHVLILSWIYCLCKLPTGWISVNMYAIVARTVDPTE